jgi:hypothetical protein
MVARESLCEGVSGLFSRIARVRWKFAGDDERRQKKNDRAGGSKSRSLTPIRDRRDWARDDTVNRKRDSRGKPIGEN